MRFERRLVLASGVIAIVSPSVFRGFDEVTTGIEYAAVRPDHVLPAGFVHPAIRK